MEMTNKRILTIQDISCVGQCSLTVALPVISACGVETCVLPSAVLSAHTGFEHYTFCDLTAEIPQICEKWKQENISFDAFYGGYLGNAAQIQYVLDIMQTLGTPDSKRIVDPAMADNGKLYAGFDMAHVAAMRSLCAAADIILPNITEACLLTGMEYRETYDRVYITNLLQKLRALGAETVILTGVSYHPEQTGVMIFENGETTYYAHKRLSPGSHGTGDVYASAFVGALMRGKTAQAAAQIAADFTLSCIENTMEDPSHWYGVKFEGALGKLIARLEE